MRFSRRCLKSFLGRIFWPFPVRHLSDWKIRGNQGLILMFHYVGQPILKGAADDLFLSLENFCSILDFISSEFCPLEPIEFLDDLAAGRLPARAALLTFDDGTRDHVTLALPELIRRKLKACFFVCPGLVGSKRSIPTLELMQICAEAQPGNYSFSLECASVNGEFLLRIDNLQSKVAAYHKLSGIILKTSSRKQSILLQKIRDAFGMSRPHPALYPMADWQGIESLHREGMTLGNHTMLHSTPVADGVELFKEDLEEAFRSLENHFSIKRRLFAYCYGGKEDLLPEAKDILRSQNVEFGFLTQGGLARSGNHDLLSLKREEASYSKEAVQATPLLAMLR